MQTDNRVVSSKHSASPTKYGADELVEVLHNPKTNIEWDFHERFPNSLKTSQNYVELDDWLQWLINEFKLNTWDNRGTKFKYMEVGSYAGESLYYVSQVLPKGSTIVLLDLGDNTVARPILWNVMEYVINKFNHYVVLISGDSTDPANVKRVLDVEDKYHVCFIDGNHTFDVSYLDYINFRDHAERIVFHDISQDNIDRDVKKYPPKGQPLVSHLWKGIKSTVNQKCGIGLDKESQEYQVDNWLEIVDNTSGLKPRGFGIIYGGKFG